MAKSVKPNGRGASPPKKAAPKKAAKKASKKKAAKTSTSPSVYIRNLHNGAGGVRLDLDDKRIFLAPRGQIGDLLQIADETRQDPLYQRNVNLLFEELSLEEGAEVLRKQNINAQAYRGPNPMDFITNEHGKKYAQAKATITPSMESQGVTVATLSEGADGRFTSGNQDINRVGGDQATTQNVAGPQEVQVPGSRRVFDPNVMPAGLTTAQAGLFLETPPEKRLELLEYFEGQSAEQYRDGLQVSVQPTEEVTEE